MEKINFPHELSPNMSSFSDDFSKKGKEKKKYIFCHVAIRCTRGFSRERLLMDCPKERLFIPDFENLSVASLVMTVSFFALVFSRMVDISCAVSAKRELLFEKASFLYCYMFWKTV